MGRDWVASRRATPTAQTLPVGSIKVGRGRPPCSASWRCKVHHVGACNLCEHVTHNASPSGSTTYLCTRLWCAGASCVAIRPKVKLLQLSNSVVAAWAATCPGPHFCSAACGSGWRPGLTHNSNSHATIRMQQAKPGVQAPSQQVRNVAPCAEASNGSCSVSCDHDCTLALTPAHPSRWPIPAKQLLG